jgi:hypothetical protein
MKQEANFKDCSIIQTRWWILHESASVLSNLKSRNWGHEGI